MEDKREEAAQPPEVISLCPATWQAHYRKLQDHPRLPGLRLRRDPPRCGAPSANGSVALGLTNLIPSASPCMPGLTCLTHPAAVFRGSGLTCPLLPPLKIQGGIRWGFLNVFGNREDKHELDGNLVRYIGLQHTLRDLGSNLSSGT